MRLRSFSSVLTVATAGSLVTAQPSGHKHHHVHAHVDKREPDNVTINAPGPTVVAYELNGQTLDKTAVCQGIADGSLRLTEGAVDCSDQAVSVSTAPVPSATQVAQSQVSIASNTPTESSPTASASSNNGQGLDTEFPDGTIDCSTFPSEYGPIAVQWAGLGGWSGIQYVTMQGNSISHIDTANPGDQCKPGAMCSYACPAGYQKSQWPSVQGGEGQSVGGLQCNDNGKLVLTNPTLSKNLCIQGTGATIVQNKLSENAAICRTDYPGK